MRNAKLSTLAILAIAASALISTSAAADGFAPWRASKLDSQPDPVQLRPDIGPFYAGRLADGQDIADPRPAAVDVSAWYAAGRRMPVVVATEDHVAAR